MGWGQGSDALSTSKCGRVSKQYIDPVADMGAAHIHCEILAFGVLGDSSNGGEAAVGVGLVGRHGTHGVELRGAAARLTLCGRWGSRQKEQVEKDTGESRVQSTYRHAHIQGQGHPRHGGQAG